MTDGMLAREALERKDGWTFLAAEIGSLLASSAEFRGRCWRMLEGGGGGAELEGGAARRGAGRHGAGPVGGSVGAGQGAGGAVVRAVRGSRMHRRGARSLSPVSLVGRFDRALYTETELLLYAFVARSRGPRHE